MSHAQAAAGMDRLPWLEDEPKPTRIAPARGGRNVATVALVVAGGLLVAGASYWMGAHSWRPAASPTETIHSSTTTAVPQPQPAGPPEQAQPEVALEPPPEVRPAPVREVPIERPRIERKIAERHVGTAPVHEPQASAPEEKTAASPAAKPAPPPANADARPLTVWPAWKSQGSKGRIVRIGAFGTREQAKLGWRYMVEAYPAVAHLKATVVGDSNSRGRHFYRFQIGTTSQAHSEVLCQRMEKIHLSCAVVGLPWQPGGVER